MVGSKVLHPVLGRGVVVDATPWLGGVAVVFEGRSRPEFVSPIWIIRPSDPPSPSSSKE
jgi:hypothetical protein